MSKYIMDFVIIGAQKSATTWLTHVLRAHQDIYLPKDEIVIYEENYQSKSRMEGLMAMYEKEANSRLRGIKNTHLMFYPESPKMIFETAPNIKIIATLRNPVDRAISSYFWHLRLGDIPLLDINEGFLRIFNLGEKSKEWQSIFEPGFYAKQIQCYKNYFSSDQMHFVLHEDIKNDWSTTVNGLFEFLDVAPEKSGPIEDIAKQKPKESVYNLARIRWLNLRNPLVLYRSKDGRRILWKDINQEPIVNQSLNALVVGIDQLILSKILSNSKPQVNPEVRSKIKSIYSSDIDQLGSLIGREIPGW